MSWTAERHGVRVLCEMDTATVQLREMLAEAGEDFPDLVLIRHGSRSVYRSDNAGVVLRVHDSPTDVAAVTRHNEAIMELVGCGAPVLPPRETQPIRLPDGRCVTAWTAGDTDGISVADLGAVLRDLHGVGLRGRELGLPVWDPFPKVQRRIHAAAGNNISAGVLSPTLLRQRRFAMSASQVDGFLAALNPPQSLDDAVVEWMCQVRELTMITWLAALPARTHEVEGELRRRLDTWRSGGRWHLV